MATFSWADTARAVLASCLPCLPSSRPATSEDDDRITRRDELESLLQGAEFTDTEADADALSLHSNIGRDNGRRRVKKKRTRNKGSMTLFGFDLFGRPLPPDVDSADEDERDAQRRVSRISSSTLDSDAAPLAEDAIAELSAQSPEQRAADEARKARKRLRKQQKAAALLDVHGNTFEGFPGSGALQYPTTPDDFGTFQQAPPQPEQGFEFIAGGGADEADAEADFDAGSYVRSAAPRSDSGSGTRSRTSASSPHEQVHPHAVPLPSPSSGSNTHVSKPKRSKKAKSGARSPATLSSTTTSQPRSPTSTTPAPHVEIANSQDTPFEGVPQDAVDFVGRPRKSDTRLTGESVHGEQELPPRLTEFPSPGFGRASGFPSPGLGRSGGGFPSPGLGGRKNSLTAGGQGAFLARTGDDA